MCACVCEFVCVYSMDGRSVCVGVYRCGWVCLCACGGVSV